jgi:hypothetical protein
LGGIERLEKNGGWGRHSDFMEVESILMDFMRGFKPWVSSSVEPASRRIKAWPGIDRAEKRVATGLITGFGQGGGRSKLLRNKSDVSDIVCLCVMRMGPVLSVLVYFLVIT